MSMLEDSFLALLFAILHRIQRHISLRSRSGFGKCHPIASVMLW